MIKIDKKQKELIENNALALATVNEGGSPHCIGVAFCKVIAENQILITDNYMVKTVNNIRKNSGVAIAVWEKNWEENCVGYEFIGKAEHFNKGKWYDEVKNFLKTKTSLAKRGGGNFGYHK